MKNKKLTRKTTPRKRRVSVESPATQMRPPVNLEPGHVETVMEYLARGGTIIKCPPHAASGVPASQMIYADGHALPTHSQSAEYVPSFVRDLKTYDDAQREAPSANDDGTTASWREYEQSSVPRSFRPVEDRSVSRRYEGDEA